jgi:hypothetical protein
VEFENAVGRFSSIKMKETPDKARDLSHVQRISREMEKRCPGTNETWEKREKEKLTPPKTYSPGEY